jgi:hypothetical protein
VQTPSLSTPKQVAWAGNTQPAICQLGGPSGCPIDLVAALNGGSVDGPAFGSTMTVLATLNGNANKSAAPTVNGWLLWYDCPYVQ